MAGLSDGGGWSFWHSAELSQRHMAHWHEYSSEPSNIACCRTVCSRNVIVHPMCRESRNAEVGSHAHGSGREQRTRRRPCAWISVEETHKSAAMHTEHCRRNSQVGSHAHGSRDQVGATAQGSGREQRIGRQLCTRVR
jgi:hypothetical protein